MMILREFLFIISVNYIGVCECCEGVEGEAAVLEEESDGVGCGLPQEEEEEDVEAAMAAADDEVSIKLLWVMKRRRSFMAGRRVMMIFSTWTERKKMMEVPIQTVRQTKKCSTSNQTVTCFDSAQRKYTFY